ncbi:MAG: family 43 glycosylhydrolase [Pricia sp.]
MKKALLISILLLSFAPFITEAQTPSIRNGITWFDTDGNRIRASGASILQHEGKYYMTGMDFTNGFAGLFGAGVKLYSSTDLVTWDFENVIIEPTANPLLESGERFLVRPNLVYNEKTDKFVIWSGYKNQDLTFGAVAVFSSDTVNGKYTFEKEIQPLGYDSNDSCMFVDDDGTAYYISNSKDDQSLNIYELSTDYMEVASTTPTILFAGQSKEAPVVFKKDGFYYLLNSRKTGFNPNQGQYASSQSMTSGWSTQRDFGNRLTYDTQPTTFFTVNGSQETSFFYVGDRWQDPDLRESKILFLPIEASNGNLTLDYVPELTIDIETGTWAPFDDNVYVPQDDWSVVSISSQENTTTLAAENAIDGNLNTFWNTKFSSGNDGYPHEMVIDLGASYDVSGFMCIPRQDRNPNAISDFQLFFSEDGTDWGAPVAAGRMTYWSELYFQSKPAKFVRVVARSDLNGSRFASASEFRFMTSTEYQPGRTINRFFNPDGKGWRAGDKVMVERGGQALIGVQTEFGDGQTPFYGSYSYYGPNEYYADTRIINLQDIGEEQLGTYTVTYLDDSYSVQQSTYEVAFTMQTASLSVTEADCNGSATGSASITVEGGFPPYTYTWSDGQENSEATNLLSGDYEVVVSDSEGNSISETISIEEPEPIEYALTGGDEKIYLGYGPECVALSAEDVTGGTDGYTYLWSTGETTPSVNVCPTETSTYELEVIDTKGCTEAKTVTVEVEDVDCTRGNGREKISICWRGREICIPEHVVARFLDKGATLGACQSSDSLLAQEAIAYPNSTQGDFRVQVSSQVSYLATISTLNSSGALITSQQVEINAGENRVAMDLNDAPSGIYFVQISGDGGVETLKIIKE